MNVFARHYMSATFSLLSLVQHLMRTTFSDANYVTPCATSATFSSRDNFCVQGTRRP